MTKKTLVFSLVIIFLLATVSVYLLFDKTSTPSLKEAGILVEKIPGSKNHSSDGTWWGYNQQKIARYKNIVFTYFVDNDDNPATPSKFTILMKEGNGRWQKGARLDASRPGNILVDSKGILHAFIYEATDIKENDSKGSLMHYWFSHSASGNINDYKKEILVADGEGETVNIRVGTAIGEDDTMAIAFGLTEGNGFSGHSEHLYYKKPSDGKWTHSIAGENLGHDFYYPYVSVNREGFSLLPVQDDYVPEGGNLYQKIPYFEYKGGKWSMEMITDLTKHKFAKERQNLLEQVDLYQDEKEDIHILYKERTDENNEWGGPVKHVTRGKEGSKAEIIGESNDLNWIRVIEINRELYYLALDYNNLYYKKYGEQEFKEIGNLPRGSNGSYLYVATKKSGYVGSEYVDILLLNGSSDNYPNAENYYVRVPVSLIK